MSNAVEFSDDWDSEQPTVTVAVESMGALMARLAQAQEVACGGCGLTYELSHDCPNWDAFGTEWGEEPTVVDVEL